MKQTTNSTNIKNESTHDLRRAIPTDFQKEMIHAADLFSQLPINIQDELLDLMRKMVAQNHSAGAKSVTTAASI